MRSTLILIALATATTAAPAQTTGPACWIRGDASRLASRASPLDSASAQLDGATVKVCYSRPAMRGRTVMGELVPFGEPWRLGANEATTIHVPFAAEIAGVAVEPGAYTLYVIPSDTSWQIVVNRAIERWGIPINQNVRGQDVGSGTARVETVTEPAEMLTLSFGPVSQNATDLIIEWERTRIRVPVRRLGR
ncbi:MAG: DUF2911 domain-containing protein [Gemmatimonadales bacterium]